MGAAVADLRIPSLPRRLHVREVVRAAHVEAWREVAARVWRESPTSNPQDGLAARHSLLYASLRRGRRRLWRHWVAYMGRRPVGMISAFFEGQAVFLEHLGVLPSARGSGIGAALMGVPIVHARKAGCRWAVLEPTPRAALLCEGLGYLSQHTVDDDVFHHYP